MTDRVQHVDVAALVATAGAASGPQVLWSADAQLQTNLVALPPGHEVAAHAEPDLDVTLVVLQGSGRLVTDDEADLQAPAVLLLPAGTRRALHAGPDGLVYLTAHRRRAPLLPGRGPR